MPKSDVNHQFGAMVKTWRTRLGISQEELAGRAGLHRTYVSDVERGARNVSLASINKLAAALETSVSTLCSLIGRSQADTKESSDTHAGQVEIIIVEHRAADVEVTLLALQQARVSNRVTVFTDGEEALEYLLGAGRHAQRSPAQHSRLVLLDLALPRVDGLEVLRRLKADVRTRSIPVIVMAATGRERDIASSRRLGAEGHIIKPVNFLGLSEVTPQLHLYWALLSTVPAEPTGASSTGPKA